MASYEYQDLMQNLSQWCVRNVQLLHSSRHSNNILGRMNCLWLFTHWFIDEDANFFHFFHKITNIRCLTMLLFFQNPYAIFIQILQHYHDFQSNVAIFPSVIEGYTQPYPFNGKIKLIICEIRQELSVTIHEISTSWKKRQMADPIIAASDFCYFCARCLNILLLHSITSCYQ